MKYLNILYNRRGFSLIELVIVISVIGILSVIAVPALRGYVDNRNLRTAASDLSAMFYQTKEQAVAESTEYRIVFTAGTDGNYQILRCTNIGLPCGGFSAIRTIQFSSYGSGIVLSGVALGNPVQFEPRGTISTAIGSVNLANSRGSVATVSVSLTGRANVTLALK
jgi:prepilin-type N-terminal cleavage/methylation domain-containing protein